MNCRNAFQVNQYLENCMTNRASLQMLKKGKIQTEKLRNFWRMKFIHDTFYLLFDFINFVI